MAKRPINTKRANRVRKALRSDLPRFFDLVQYLKDRHYAQTTGEAEAIILAGRVRSESHKLGIKQDKVPKPLALRRALVTGRPLEDADFEDRDVVDRYISAAFRERIQVLPS